MTIPLFRKKKYVPNPDLIFPDTQNEYLFRFREASMAHKAIHFEITGYPGDSRAFLYKVHHLDGTCMEHRCPNRRAVSRLSAYDDLFSIYCNRKFWLYIKDYVDPKWFRSMSTILFLAAKKGHRMRREDLIHKVFLEGYCYDPDVDYDGLTVDLFS